MAGFLKRFIFPLVATIASWTSTIDNSALASELLFEDGPIQKEKKRKLREREEAQFKRNISVRYGPPETSLRAINVLERILADPNRNYIGKILHLHAWQFFLLADRLKSLIERPRLRANGTRPTKIGHACKHDHYHRLYFCLEWLNTGKYFRSQEADTGWGKSSLQEDNIHVLIAIMEGLEDQIAWPDHNRRAALALIHPGIFRNLIGVMDIKEHECDKPKNADKERSTFSGKKKINSWKNLSVMDYTGRFIYVLVRLAKNDRDFFTSTPLYMQEGLWFDDGQYIASDGGFEGDGAVRYSYKDCGNDVDKITFNQAFREVRTGIETAFSRVCKWFPILGNNKRKWNYDDTTMQLAIHAASRLHNWMMNTENLSYDAITSPETYFKAYY